MHKGEPRILSCVSTDANLQKEFYNISHEGTFIGAAILYTDVRVWCSELCAVVWNFAAARLWLV